MIEVALDGPSGAGKSTLARAAAKELGFLYVDTGALYRAVALYMIQSGVNTKNAKDIASKLASIDVKLKHNDSGEQRVLLNGKDVSEEIRSAEIANISSVVSAVPEVRERLLDIQRNMSRDTNIIMDGRDIGTVVLPTADIKIFLTAAVEERANRRYLEYLAKGIEISYDEILADLKVRDLRDTKREVAPLKMAEDAVLLDSTDLSFKETLEKVIGIIGIIKNREE